MEGAVQVLIKGEGIYPSLNLSGIRTTRLINAKSETTNTKYFFRELEQQFRLQTNLNNISTALTPFSSQSNSGIGRNDRGTAILNGGSFLSLIFITKRS